MRSLLFCSDGGFVYVDPSRCCCCVILNIAVGFFLHDLDLFEFGIASKLCFLDLVLSKMGVLRYCLCCRLRIVWLEMTFEACCSQVRWCRLLAYEFIFVLAIGFVCHSQNLDSVLVYSITMFCCNLVSCPYAVSLDCTRDVCVTLN